jgi:hypothetical protein
MVTGAWQPSVTAAVSPAILIYIKATSTSLQYTRYSTASKRLLISRTLRHHFYPKRSDYAYR